jgi:putative ATP-dependent endonuclease of OLD family
MKIRHIEIRHFRGIESLSWAPSPGFNCLVGPGDSGKTTVLDAIELALTPRQQASFDDSDFYQGDCSRPFEITVTIGDLPAAFKSIGQYGEHTRGWDPVKQGIVDEPDEAGMLETVLSTQLTVDANLEPSWRIFTERLAAEGRDDRMFRFEDRKRMAPVRLGGYADRHLSWGRYSVLNRLSQGENGESEILARAIRAARESFATGGVTLFKSLLGDVAILARRVGVPLGNALNAQLDIQEISINAAGISLHDGELPLRVLGSGSSRLVVAALQQLAGKTAPFSLIDEIEHGLEPHRICGLLRFLRSSQTDKSPQAFVTTHSPIVLEELSIDELFISRRDTSTGSMTVFPANTGIPEHSAQAQIRATPSAYLARAVIVCEGKTEVGILRGLDRYWISKGEEPFATRGIAIAHGGQKDIAGKDKAPIVSRYFRSLSYRVALVLDGDRNPHDPNAIPSLEADGVKLLRWSPGKATEDVLFRDLEPVALRKVIEILETGEDSDGIVDQINSFANKRMIVDFEELKTRCADSQIRHCLAKCSKQHKWIKRHLTISERIAFEVLGPHASELNAENAKTIQELREWVDSE